ncbi:MAG: hypothetical protein EON59_04945 [Alphaproteobacteria bacterium]|nr:MAG: hypothetical protein EON59_04945 [Alphaproteobacteria bacterium]
MAERVIIHLGPHKTGTTAFQKYLALNGPALLAAGFAVACDLKSNHSGAIDFGQSTNCYRLAHHFIRGDLETPMRLAKGGLLPSAAQRLAVATSFNGWARALPQQNLIVSSEAFSFLRTDEERSLLNVMTEGLAVHPVAVRRDSPHWLSSWEAQLRKMGLTAPPGDISGTVFDIGPNSWMLDTAQLEAFWGPALRWLDYEAAVAMHGSIIPAISSLIGLPAGLESSGRWDNVTADK